MTLADGRVTPPPALHGLVATSWNRTRTELLQFRRSPEAMFFTVAFPALMLLLFGTIFRNQQIGPPHANVSFAQYFFAGMIGSAIWWTSFTNIAVTVSLERDSGALKRLAGTPMPRSAYFIGKIMLTLIITIGECALLIVLGAVLYHVQLPRIDRWVTFGWVLLLGDAACTLFGLGVAGLVPSGRSASAVVSPFAIVLQFLSGVYVVYGDLAGWMQGLGSVFPLEWLTLGMRSVFLPSRFRTVEPQHSWLHGQAAIVLGVWCAVGLAVTLLTFRWTPTRER